MSGLLLTLYYSVDGKYQGTITTAKLPRFYLSTNGKNICGSSSKGEDAPSN